MHRKLERASAVPARTAVPAWTAMLAWTAVLAMGSATWAQEERVLTVEQTAIQAVQAPPAAAGNPLDVVAWVD